VEDTSVARKAWLFYTFSLLMVLGQIAALMGVSAGMGEPACSSNDQCEAGSFCGNRLGSRCLHCGDSAPWYQNHEQWPVHANEENFNNLTLISVVCATPYTEYTREDGNTAVTFVAPWCENCVHNDGTADPLTTWDGWDANVAAMGLFDWATLVFAACVVALKVAQELRDIKLCSIAVAHAGGELGRGWRFALGLLGGEPAIVRLLVSILVI
jgi:hypothetical protein